MSEQQPSTSWASPAQTRVTFCTHKKSPKKRRETRTPFLSNRTPQRLDTRLPLKYRWASSPLVIGAVGYALRLTALVLRDFAVFVIGNPGFFQRSRQSDTGKQMPLSLQKGGSRSRTRYPPQIRFPKDLAIQWQRSSKSHSVQLGKVGSGVSPAAFWLLCRRGQSNPRRSAESPKIA